MTNRRTLKDSKLVALRECLQRAEFDDLKDGRGKTPTGCTWSGTRCTGRIRLR